MTSISTLWDDVEPNRFRWVDSNVEVEVEEGIAKIDSRLAPFAVQSWEVAEFDDDEGSSVICCVDHRL